MNILGSTAFNFNGLDWQSVKRTIYRALGGAIITIVPEFLSPDIHYVLSFRGHNIDYTVVVMIAGTAIVRAVEAFLTDNTK